MPKVARRDAIRLAAAALAVPHRRARADEKALSIGMSVPLTGALAQQVGGSCAMPHSSPSTRRTRKAASADTR